MIETIFKVSALYMTTAKYINAMIVINNCLYIGVTMKSPVVMRSTLVSRVFRISLNTRPMSFFDTLDTAQISNDKGGVNYCSQGVHGYVIMGGGYVSYWVVVRDGVKYVFVFKYADLVYLYFIVIFDQKQFQIHVLKYVKLII